MSQITKIFRTIPQTTWRRLRYTPSYFFLLWRWVTWLLALITIVSDPSYQHYFLAALLLTITFLQTLMVTLYAPVFQILLPNLPRIRQLRPSKQSKLRRIWRRRQPGQPLATDEDADILTPIARTHNAYWDITIYGIDVIICGLVTYYGGYFGRPHFGVGSPFYRYGISCALAAALAYRYRGGLAAALGYDLFIVFGAIVPPTQTPYIALNVRDVVSSLLDAPVIAILAAYMITLLESYTRSKRREQDNVRNQRALLRVGETLVTEASDRQKLLQQSAREIRIGGHFERLIIALLRNPDEEEPATASSPEIDTCIESGLVESPAPDKSQVILEQVVRSGEKHITFEFPDGKNDEDTYGMARLYLPFFQDGHVSMILGAESTRQRPFEQKQEEFLTIVGAQLVVALENIRLTEQTAELAAAAERGRIAREIHDGVAQLVYILSLNTETCAALAHRIVEASQEDEDKEVLTPLAERLDKLVTISKQALWETRHYMFTLKPLISGTSTLTQMLTNQLREFETISGLPVQLEVEGSEETTNGDRRSARKMAQVGTAIFRITQEALTNAYKHAEATQLHVHLRYLPDAVEIEICDNGKGLGTSPYSYDLAADGERLRIYSGHGIHGMRERAEELGGTFEVKQSATGGVSVRASLPK